MVRDPKQPREDHGLRLSRSLLCQAPLQKPVHARKDAFILQFQSEQKRIKKKRSEKERTKSAHERHTGVAWMGRPPKSMPCRLLGLKEGRAVVIGMAIGRSVKLEKGGQLQAA